MTSAGPTCRSAAIAGRAMFAIAVSSEAIATAVKMAAAAHPRRSAGRPSIAAGPSAEMISVDIREGLQLSGCSTDNGQPAGGSLHAAYARGDSGDAEIRCPYAGDRLLCSGQVQCGAEQER